MKQVGELKLSEESKAALLHAVQARIGVEADYDEYLQHFAEWLRQPNTVVIFRAPA